mmetsp:Transcript_44532/g.127639  ORF Transcript_44532/g.127639 Transcript_44532/m.127639 type:complete len:234 (-) Transcript_44532:1063-1764(-)
MHRVTVRAAVSEIDLLEVDKVREQKAPHVSETVVHFVVLDVLEEHFEALQHPDRVGSLSVVAHEVHPQAARAPAEVEALLPAAVDRQARGPGLGAPGVALEAHCEYGAIPVLLEFFHRLLGGRLVSNGQDEGAAGQLRSRRRGRRPLAPRQRQAGLHASGVRQVQRSRHGQNLLLESLQPLVPAERNGPLAPSAVALGDPERRLKGLRVCVREVHVPQPDKLSHFERKLLVLD